MAEGPGVAHVAWYATGLRGDEMEAALREFAPTAYRYGATEWSVHRSTEDPYKFLQMVRFEDKRDWTLYWNGPEAIRFRAEFSGAYQQLLAYSWFQVVVEGPEDLTPEEAVAASAVE